jgi:hypothetical protein
MPRQSSLTVPLAIHSKSQRRRSADARLTGSTRTPGLSWDDPIALSSDEDNNKDQNDDDTTQTRPKSGELPPSRQPTTPVRPRLPNIPATDPGPLRTEQEASDTRAKSYQQRDMLPCGKQYVYPMGKRSREHRINCDECRRLDNQVHEAHEKEMEQLGRADKSSTPCGSGASDNNNSRPNNSNDEEKGKQSQYFESQKRDQVASMIHHRLIQDAKERLTEKERDGYLYILRSPQKPGLLKLGCSRDVSKRGKEQKCVEDFTWVETGKFVTRMKRAEKLAKRDLNHLRRDWKCSKCSKTHEEWFEVDEETAKEVIKRWTEWINKQVPYELNKQTPNDEHWRLKPMWAWLMDEQRAPRVSFGDDDHQARWTHWDRVLSPPSFKTKVEYSKKAGPETPNQQRDGKELYLPYRQPTLKD